MENVSIHSFIFPEFSRFNKISYIPPLLFHPTRTPKVEVIQLSHNRIKELKSGTFTGLERLERLQLNDNDIAIIHKHAFKELPSLVELNLAGNHVVNLPRGTMANLPALTLLDLSFNRLREWPSLENVKTKFSGPFVVNLRSNLISILEGSSSEEESLAVTTLDVSSNNISFVSPLFFRPFNGSLTTLDLSNNLIQKLDAASMAGTDDVRILRLDGNEIQFIEPESFKRNKNLEVLSLDNNHELASIHPELFSEMKKLRVLTMAETSLESLENETFKGTALEVLDLSGLLRTST